MKKVLFAVAIASVSIVACNNAETKAPAADTTVKVTTDTTTKVAIDTTHKAVDTVKTVTVDTAKKAK